jgi:hypothetical protein
MFSRAYVKHVLGLIRQASGGTNLDKQRGGGGAARIKHQLSSLPGQADGPQR